MNCHELAKPGSTVSCCTYMQTQTIQFYPGSIQFEREPHLTGFNLVRSTDTPKLDNSSNRQRRFVTLLTYLSKAIPDDVSRYSCARM